MNNIKLTPTSANGLTVEVTDEYTPNGTIRITVGAQSFGFMHSQPDVAIEVLNGFKADALKGIREIQIQHVHGTFTVLNPEQFVIDIQEIIDVITIISKKEPVRWF
jgi:hypothetical protein